MTTLEPVLVIGFNRPELLRKLIRRLGEVKPRKVYLAIDGPRADRLEEGELVQQSQEVVSLIDWPCEISTLFRETNLGCGEGVSQAITWFFENEERGIILEDDILPDPTFFEFCSELLERYNDDDRIFAISGCNFVPPEHQSDPAHPYRFTNVPHVWGWATWRRSWREYELDISKWRTRLPSRALWREVDHSLPGFVYWNSTFELLARKQVDTWDGQLVLTAMQRSGLIANSNVNLIENIGFGPDATHTKEDRPDLRPPVASVVFPLTEVPVIRDKQADAWTRKHHFLATWRGMLGQAQRFLALRSGER